MIELNENNVFLLLLKSLPESICQEVSIVDLDSSGATVENMFVLPQQRPWFWPDSCYM